MSSSTNNTETRIPTSVKLLKPNVDGYQEWADKSLEIIRGRFGTYANFLKNKQIPKKLIEIPEAPDQLHFPAQFAVWKEEMSVVISRKNKIEEQSPNVIGILQAMLSEESKIKLKEVDNYNSIVDTNDAIKFKTHIGVETVNEEVQRIIEKIRLKMVQQPDQDLSAYSEDCTKKIQRLEYMGCNLDQKELAIQFLLGLNNTIFGVKVGQTLSDLHALPGTFQLTKEMILNWYKGQLSANAIPTSKMLKNAKSKTYYDHYDSVSDSINITRDENVTCIFCKKRGHGAQVCRKLIRWLSRKNNKDNKDDKNDNEIDNLAYFDED